ncbi:MAG: hypothetical protein AAF611_21920 [Bacteroidota bacterium]
MDDFLKILAEYNFYKLTALVVIVGCVIKLILAISKVVIKNKLINHTLRDKDVISITEENGNFSIKKQASQTLNNLTQEENDFSIKEYSESDLKIPKTWTIIRSKSSNKNNNEESM